MRGILTRAALAASVIAAAVVPTASMAQADIPNPIDPSSGEGNLLDIIQGLPLNDIESALDHFPIPYVVVASAGGAPPTIENKNAGSPLRVDADQSKATGKGGNDIIVEVNTELLPSPHLNLSIERIEGAPYAEDLSVVVAFPFAAFSDEALPAAPNLFFGYDTTAPFDGGGYPAGGHAPASVDFDITPGFLAGTAHTFELDITTVGDDNPVRFIGGHFDGNPGTTPVNALAFAAHADPVPTDIELALDVDFSQILLGGSTQSEVGVSWTASEPSKVTFDYLENEDFPFTEPDYNTTLTFDLMPVSEQITLGADFAAGQITLGHQGSSPIGALTLLHEREDGLAITGVASDVPTMLDLTLDTAGSATIDVNANTMDLDIVATQDGGFPGSDGFFGYPIGYLSLVVEDVPDITAAWDPAEDRYEVHALNAGESIGLVELVLDDDATVDDLGVVSGLDLPPSWSDAPTHHIFALHDDGTHGTAAGRAVHLSDVVLDLATAPVVSNHFEFGTTAAAPMQARLMTTTASNITGEDIDATCDVDDVPAGLVTIDLAFPPPTIDFDYSAVPPATIDSVTCTGTIGTLNFLMGISDLPAEFGFEFDPDSMLDVTAGNGVDPAPSAFVGQLLLRLWDSEAPAGLPDTDGLLGTPLRDAVAQADDVPSLLATWSDDPTATLIDVDTDAASGAFAHLGGTQVQVSTDVELSTPLATPTTNSDHYLSLVDEGTDARKFIEAGVFGIDHVGYQATDADRTIAAQYAADTARRLVVDIDSALGGRFLSDYDIDATLEVDAVPATWDFSTNLATELAYTASSGIDSVDLVADVGIETDPMVVQTTHIEAALLGLPSSVEYFLDPAVDGEAYVHMNAPIDSAVVELTSDDAILEGDYKHMRFSAEDIPANWDVEWGITPEPHANLTTSSPLGPVEVIVSRDVAANTPTKYADFQNPVGAVNYTDFAREIDRRYFRLGAGDDATRETVFMSRIDSVYDSTAQLDVDEDHFIMRENGDGDMDFLSVRGTGFQSLGGEVTGSAITATLTIPFVGDHPFFVGLSDSENEATIVQVENIPDTTTIEIALDHADVVFDTAPGEVLVYQGPFGVAPDGSDVLKVLVPDAPAEIHAAWDLGFPGGAELDLSSPVEVRLLNQSGNDRTLADFQVEDLSAEWGFDTTSVEGFKCQTDPPGCGTYLKLVEVFAGFEADPEIEGFVASYERIGSPDPLDGGGPPPGDNEFVPRITVLVDDFEEFGVSAELEVCIVPIPACPIGVPTVGTTVDTDLLGSFNFDWWDLGGDFLGDPDYIDNDPWDFWPLFHAQSSHLFPFN